MNRYSKFKRKIRRDFNTRNVPISYYFEENFKDPDRDRINATIYDSADKLEWQRIFGLSTLSPENQLEELQKEIKIRVKITKNEIFKIGELLIYAKKICQQQGKKFQEWISNNLDFSYETANNFMNVYKHCLGDRTVAMHLSPSILYQISAPNFPDELRKYLFDTEQLDEITNGRLREITRKYKEGGLEAIKDDLEEVNRGQLIIKQSSYTLDIVENALRTLEDLKEKLERQGSSHRSFVSFEDQIQKDEPEAFEIKSKLNTALQSAIDLLDKARLESEQILYDMQDKLFEKCGVVEPDDRKEKKWRAEMNEKYGSKL